MSKSKDTDPERLRVHRVYLDGEKAYCFAVQEETTTEWLESTETVKLEDWC
jgi:hypothetical protein